VGAREPGAGAAVLPTVALPGVVPELAGCWNGVRPPQALAGLGVVGVDETANAILAAGDSGDDFVLERQWGGGDAVALHGVSDLRLPNQRAAAGVERHQCRIERSEVDPVSEDGDTAVDPVALVRVHDLLRTLVF